MTDSRIPAGAAAPSRREPVLYVTAVAFAAVGVVFLILSALALHPADPRLTDPDPTRSAAELVAGVLALVGALVPLSTAIALGALLRR